MLSVTCTCIAPDLSAGPCCFGQPCLPLACNHICKLVCVAVLRSSPHPKSLSMTACERLALQILQEAEFAEMQKARISSGKSASTSQADGKSGIDEDSIFADLDTDGTHKQSACFSPHHPLSAQLHVIASHNPVHMHPSQLSLAYLLGQIPMPLPLLILPVRSCAASNKCLTYCQDVLGLTC